MKHSSGLDIALPAQIVRLLIELQARHSLTYLYIFVTTLNFISLVPRNCGDGCRTNRGSDHAGELRQSAHPGHALLVEAS